MQITMNAQKVDLESVKYRILSMLEQLAAERREWSREHEQYRQTGRTAALDRMAESIGMRRPDFYDALEGRRIFTPLERKKIARYLTIHERDLWYGRPDFIAIEREREQRERTRAHTGEQVRMERKETWQTR